MAEVLDPIARLKAVQAKQAEIDNKMTKAVKTADARTPAKSDVFGLPSARTGENILGSRGYSYLKAIGRRSNLIRDDECKIEMDLNSRLRGMLDGQSFKYANDSVIANTGGTFVAPLGSELLCGDEVTAEFRHEIKSLSLAGTQGADLDEMRWIASKAYAKGVEQAQDWHQGKTNQSWLDETLGGALVAPPEFGELIQLLRNKDALMNAGARVIPLPPSGRIRYPRQTAATTGYFIGENTTITASNFLTGSLLLSAKKCAAIVTMPNELIRFASPAAEAILRADMTKTLSLTFDYYALQGVGSDNVPLGLINTPGVAAITPTTAVQTNTGAILSPQDLFLFPSAVEANNAEFQGWILRPEMFYLFVAARAGVYTGSGTSAVGQFVYDQFRQLGQGFNKVLAGYPAVTTPQVTNGQQQGNSTANLTYVVGGQWDDMLLAMFGTIEFAQAFQGDTAFAQDQTVVRAILTCDSGPRHPGAFAVATKLQQSLGA